MMSFSIRIHAGSALIALAAIFAQGCARQHARQIQPAVKPVSFPRATAEKNSRAEQKKVLEVPLESVENGIASWYGDPYHGRRAASGEVFDKEKLTAAHRTLPFQTWVEVTNLSNGRRVDVRITDRGPFIGGRIIDLSEAAAREIDMVRAGIAQVSLRVLEARNIEPLHSQPPNNNLAAAVAPLGSAPLAAVTAKPLPFADAPHYTVQAGAFAERARAESLAVTFAKSFGEARVRPLFTSASPNTPYVWRILVGRELSRDQADALAERLRAQFGEAVVIEEPLEVRD